MERKDNFSTVSNGMMGMGISGSGTWITNCYLPVGHSIAESSEGDKAERLIAIGHVNIPVLQVRVVTSIQQVHSTNIPIRKILKIYLLREYKAIWRASLSLAEANPTINCENFKLQTDPYKPTKLHPQNFATRDQTPRCTVLSCPLDDFRKAAKSMLLSLRCLGLATSAPYNYSLTFSATDHIAMITISPPELNQHIE